jgi:cytochrome c oxidase subunit 3
VTTVEQSSERINVGVTLWLASELMFFAGLFAAYFTLRGAAQVWPPSDVHLDPLRGGISTAVLVLSSVTLWRADEAAVAGRRSSKRHWLVATLLLGSLFLANQLLEYAGLGFTVSSSTFASMFYIMTGFHGLHVLGGLVLIALLTTAAFINRDADDRTQRVVSYYWHFVDAVWIVLYATLYLMK